MKSKNLVFALLLTVLMVGFVGLLVNHVRADAMRLSAAPQAMTDSTFTYQGRLTDSGNAANGSYDFQFSLYDAASGGTQVGSPISQAALPVVDGLFTTSLDFGGIFDGTALWLQITVRLAGSGSYTTLSPRQPLTAVPYALSLRPGASTTGNIGDGAVFSVHNMGTDYTTIGVYGRSDGLGIGVYGEGYTGVNGHGVDGSYLKRAYLQAPTTWPVQACMVLPTHR